MLGLSTIVTTALVFSLAIGVFAQSGNIDQLPDCATDCVVQASSANNCVLATPSCICPSASTIHTCISQECPVSDQTNANAIVTQFCGSITWSTTPSPPLPSGSLNSTVPSKTLNKPTTSSSTQPEVIITPFLNTDTGTPVFVGTTNTEFAVPSGSNGGVASLRIRDSRGGLVISGMVVGIVWMIIA